MTLVKIALLVEKIGTALYSAHKLSRIVFFPQKGPLDITPWLVWFLETLDATLDHPLDAIQRTLMKSRFWQRPATLDISSEQQKVLNRQPGGGRNTRYQIAFGD